MLNPSVAARTVGYGIEAVSVDGNDLEAVHDAASKAVAAIRETGKPYLLETVTDRQRGHSGPDDQAYVDKKELEHWLGRDPILLLKKRLESAGILNAADITRIEERIAARVSNAVAFAQASPYPPIENLTTQVYA